MKSFKDKFDRGIKWLYGFYYKGYSVAPKKSASESLSLFLLTVSPVVSTFLLTLLFKITTLFGIYFEDRTIIFTILGFLIIDMLIVALLDKYIKNENIITDKYLEELEKDIRKQSGWQTFFNFCKGFCLYFFFFLLFILIYVVMVKVLDIKSIA